MCGVCRFENVKHIVVECFGLVYPPVAVHKTCPFIDPSILLFLPQSRRALAELKINMKISNQIGGNRL